MTLINLTPHPIRIYPVDTPDRIDPVDHEPLAVIPTSPERPVGHLTMDVRSTRYFGYNGGHGVAEVPLLEVAYGDATLPAPYPGVQLVVSLATGLALRHDRSDLLVPYGEVRSMAGTVVGCRSLARPL